MQPIVRGYGNKLKIPFVLMTIVAVAALAAAGYLFWQFQEADKAKNTAQNDLKSAQQEVQSLKEDSELKQVATNASKPNDQKSSQSASDPAVVAKTYYAAASKSTGIDAAKLSANQVQESGNFRRYSISGDGPDGGASVIVKKVGDIWVGVHAGQAPPTKAVGEEFNLPSGWYGDN